MPCATAASRSSGAPQLVEEPGDEGVAATERRPGHLDRFDRVAPLPLPACPRPAVEDPDRPGAHGHDQDPTEIERHLAHARHRRVVLGAGPADEPEVDVAHRLREALDRVVAEAEEIRGDPHAREGAIGGQSLELGDRALDEHDVEALGGPQRIALARRKAVVGPHAGHEVVHVRLPIRQDLDVDRARAAWRGELLPRDRRDAMPVQECLDRAAVERADAGEQLEPAPEAAPVPGHVEHAATGQDLAAREVPVEADRPEEERPRTAHESASGSARCAPEARNRS